MAAKKMFDFKAITKNLPGVAANYGGIVAGVVISKKFLDPAKLMKDADPESFVVKQAPLIKLALGLAGVAMSNGLKPMAGGINILGSLSMGIALEGGITYIRQVTAKEADDGTMEYLYDPIGNVQDLQQTSAVGYGHEDDMDGIQNPDITMAVGYAVAGMGVGQDIEDAEVLVELDDDEIDDL